MLLFLLKFIWLDLNFNFFFIPQAVGQLLWEKRLSEVKGIKIQVLMRTFSLFPIYTVHFINGCRMNSFDEKLLKLG